MRVSRHFDEAEWTGNRQSSLPTDSIPKSGRFLTPIHCGLKRNFRCARVVGSDAAMTSPHRWVPQRCCSLQEPASLVRKRRKRKSPAKSCSPGNARSRASVWPASAWPTSSKSYRAEQAPPAKYSWPLRTSTKKTLNRSSAGQSFGPLSKIHTTNMGYISHIWDYTNFGSFFSP